ncbi:UNVERIFIED_CONTAM: hypothetical protein FKN15_025454 [Acipenser sinensis]
MGHREGLIEFMNTEAAPVLKTGRKWAAKKAVEDAKAALRIGDIMGQVQHGRGGLGLSSAPPTWHKAAPAQQRKLVVNKVQKQERLQGEKAAKRGVGRATTWVTWLATAQPWSVTSLGQKQLGETQTEIQQRIQKRLKDVEELKQAVKSLKRAAQREMVESEKIFTELIRSIEKIHTEVIELIGANEKAAVNQAEGRMKKLEQEISELRRRNAELKQLSETEDHIHFLQNFQSLCAPPEAGNLPSITVNTDISFGAVREAVSELKDHIEDFCKGELVKITTTDSCQLTLDPNTAHRNRWLSEGNRKVTCREETQPYPYHREI